ncbi:MULTISPECIES: acyl-CoA dehydrogenase family protein [unclassified Streptomyces]|uniref:acyl-CoA dehydrogenase family protein n=1 Tax=unclassified Streptomyces TaxID=2593676 RepID=UPI001CD5BBC0|nr:MULTISPECIES: acyl-CoA dehydrogenase family protein [unclassified Streptomyces]
MQVQDATVSGAATDAVAAPGDFWQRVARDFGDDLAVDALDRDRAGKPPNDEVARLRESGLPGVLAPPGTAGGGTDWEHACAIVRGIAAADGSIGELLGRHYVLSWSPRFFAPPEQAVDVETRAAREQWLWAGDTGSSRADGAAAPGDEGTVPVLVPVDGGFLLSGQRSLATAVSVADRLVLDAVCTSTGEAFVVLVDPRHPGVSRDRLPDRLGQRLADAGTVHFDDVPIGAGDVLGAAAHDEDVVDPFATVAPLAVRLMLTQVALGVAEGALAEARDLSRVASRTRRAAVGGNILTPADGTDPDVSLAFGELALAAHSASAVVDQASAAMARALRAGRELDPERHADTAALVAAAETVAFRAALLVGERVLELAGAEGLDRFWRNIRVLARRGSSGPTLRAIGDHFLNSVRTPSAQWT